MHRDSGSRRRGRVSWVRNPVPPVLLQPFDASMLWSAMSSRAHGTHGGTHTLNILDPQKRMFHGTAVSSPVHIGLGMKSRGTQRRNVTQVKKWTALAVWPSLFRPTASRHQISAVARSALCPLFTPPLSLFRDVEKKKRRKNGKEKLNEVAAGGAQTELTWQRRSVASKRSAAQPGPARPFDSEPRGDLAGRGGADRGGAGTSLG